VPDRTVTIVREHLRKGRMCRASLFYGRRLLNGRSDQRVAELEAIRGEHPEA
jgi:hypothetical protein